jgi:OOP family OmpA-OmpF porin
MSEALPPNESPSPPPAASAPVPDDLEQIRELLLGREKQQLSHLRQRLENPVLHAQDVSRVLPQAVALASARDGQFATALTPAVEAALKESVRRDPSPLVSAVFPIIGPAIRKAIAEAFSKLVQSVNQTLDHSLSPRAFRWRLEAARTGRSFAEVVLAHTLVYRVEQVFLIHRRTSLLLQHVQAPEARAMDADMVSSMLAAIQDFAQDSFQAPHGESLDAIQVGELTVWVESSPLATLAAVIRGQAPQQYRTLLATALETIHREHSAALEAFAGDAAPFELARPRLEACLMTQFAERPRKSSVRLWLLLVIVALALAVWGFRVWRENRRWSGYVERLKAEEGLVIADFGKRGGRFHVAGLRDPLAADPAQFLGDFGLAPEKVSARWEPYHALGPGFVLKRAVQALQPPGTVSLRLQDGVLYAEGRAPAGWAEAARRRAETLPGVVEFNTAGLSDETQAVLASRQQAIERTTLFFDEAAQLAPGQDDAVNALATQILELRQAAARANRSFQIAVVGHTDPRGTEELNLRLSRQRAEVVVSRLVERGVPSAWLAPTGQGSREPLRPGLPAAQQQLNRRVMFRVQWHAPGGAAP